MNQFNKIHLTTNQFNLVSLCSNNKIPYYVTYRKNCQRSDKRHEGQG